MKRLLVLLAACNDPLDQRLAIVREPRVLAITSEPAEAKPGESVTYRALVASPDGPLAVAPAWSLCTDSKPPTEDNAVSPLCLDHGIELGAAATIDAAIPDDACIRFGPDVPPGGFRPRDPDVTGGYYQPVRAQTDVTDLAIGFTRITCKLANAPADVAHDYQLGYVANRNPSLTVELTGNVLTARWPSTDREEFLYFDRTSQTLVVRRETMRVSWFATAGSFPVDATASDGDNAATPWQPAHPAWLWIVLRDSRGGIATQTIEVP